MSKNREILFLQASADEIRLCAARLAGDKVELSHATSFRSGTNNADATALSDQTTVDALTAYVRERGWAGRQAFCLLGGSSVAWHQYELPPLNGTALRQAATLKLGQQLHFDVGSAVVNVEAVGPAKSEHQIRVNVAAVHRDQVRASLEAAASARLNVVGLSVTPAAIAALAAYARRGVQGYLAVLHMDEKVSTLVVLDGETPLVVTELPFGGADLTAALMRPIIAGENVIKLDDAAAVGLRNGIGIPTAQQEIVSIQITGDRLLPLLEPVLQKFAKQVTQWLSFASTCTGGVPVKSMKLIGPCGSVPGLASSLGARLSVEVAAEHWLAQQATFAEDVEGQTLDSFAGAVAVAKLRNKLPDLIPPEIRRQRRINRVQRVITWTGPCVTAAVIALAVMFGRIGANAEASIAKHQRELDQVRAVVDENARWAAVRGKAHRLSACVEEFSRCSPLWLGVFKELSLLLPAEMKALEYNCKTSKDGITLFVKAGVYTEGYRRTFDEIVAQTVLLLQRSPFFKRVELSANRDPQTVDAQAAGVVSIELELVFPKAKAKG